MNKYEMATMWKLADIAGEKYGYYPCFLSLRDQCILALYYLNDIIAEIGEESTTGRMWMKWEYKIRAYYNSL